MFDSTTEIEVNVTALKSLLDSSGWLELKRNAEEIIEDLRDMLEQGSDQDERVRGRLEAIRTMLEWPETAVALEEAQRQDQPKTED